MFIMQRFCKTLHEFEIDTEKLKQCRHDDARLTESGNVEVSSWL